MEGPTGTEQVRAEIEVAFGTLEPPDFGPILATLDPKDDESPVLRELNGKGWKELAASYLQERWSHFGYLNAEGYRYYLPALLVRCLDDFSTDNGLVHSTLFSLRPHFWRLYHNGQDKKFEYHTSLFDEEQYKAVCSFLGLAAELLFNYRFLCFSALRWGWNRYEHPAVEQSRAFYEGCYNYQYPAVQDPAIAELVEQVESAFASTPYPGDDNICEPRPGDDEPAEYALEFRGATWQRLDPIFLGYHYASLSFFTHPAFRYFLPAYLVAELRGPELDNWPDTNPVFHLTHGLAEHPQLSERQIQQMVVQLNEDDPEAGLTIEDVRAILQPPDIDWHARALERFAGFTPAERSAIVSYLQHAAELDPYERERIETALEVYWRGDSLK